MYSVRVLGKSSNLGFTGNMVSLVTVMYVYFFLLTLDFFFHSLICLVLIF